MIDRHRSLIRTLMAGLIGLTLGLFIGWWVWPVQWIEAPGTVPAASEPAQSVERPAVENEQTVSNSTDFLDWFNQGLLYVAAALLLAGGVVIGYQLLRQTQGSNPPAPPFPLPFKRSRANQATAAREPRANSPPLAGRPARQGQPGLNWLRRESSSERPAAADEPVFSEQPVSVPHATERGLHSQKWEGEQSGSVEGTETGLHTARVDEVPLPEGTPELLAGGSFAPPEQAVEGESGTESPASFDAPETAMEGFRDNEAGLDEEKFAVGVDGDPSMVESGPDEFSDEPGVVVPAVAAPADFGSEGLDGSRDSEDQDLWNDDLETLPSGAPLSDAQDEPEEESVAATGLHAPLEDSAGPDGPFAREEEGTEAALFRGQESGSFESGQSQPETALSDRAARQLVGQFEANYAFGIQSYDESFTINSADGELLGACGIGINESVDRDAANSDRVRLLDVWLYDRAEVRSVSRPLISPGFDVSGVDDFAEGGGSDASSPLEVFPGLNCTLRSDSIVLDCTIKSASFLDGELAPMPFRSVSVSLAVYVQS